MDNQVKEILCITQEECSEVSQSVSKIFRFGFTGMNPNTLKQNKEHLEEEIGDLLCMVDILTEKCIISDSKVNEARKAKREKLKKWSSIEGL